MFEDLNDDIESVIYNLGLLNDALENKARMTDDVDALQASHNISDDIEILLQLQSRLNEIENDIDLEVVDEDGDKEYLDEDFNDEI